MRRRERRLDVRAHDVQALAALTIASIGEPAIDRLDVRLATWAAPKGWVGRPGIGGLVELRVRPAGRGASVRLVIREAVDPALLLAAALRILRPVPTGSVHPRMAFAAGLPEQVGSIAHFVRDIVRPDDVANPHLRRTELVVAPPGFDPAAVERLCDVVVDGHRWHVTDVGQPTETTDVAVDPLVHRPHGRRSDAPVVVGSASVADSVLTVRGDDLLMRVHGDLDAGHVQALRALRGVRTDGDLGARWSTQLRACGLVVASADEPLPADDDHLGWLQRSVDGTRDAMRTATPTAAWNGWPGVAVVLVTHRDTYIDHAVRQLTRLDYPRLQLVIGRHGDAFDPARLDPLRASGHDVTVVDIDGSTPFGDALQMASARASATLIAKVDDDDYYAPTHIWDLVIARMHSGAQLIGKALDWVHLEGEQTTVFRPAYAAERYATFVAGGTLLISAADLNAVGGWASVPKSVDRALIERVQASGGLVYRTHGLGYVYVRHAGEHTAQVREEHFLTKTTATYPGLLAHFALGTAAPGTAAEGAR